MMKFLKDLWKDFATAQKELNEVGIWFFTSHGSFFSYFDNERYETYLKKMKEQDNS